MALASVPAGLFGLFLDQARGLFAYNPVYLFALPAGLLLATRDPRWSGGLAAVSAALFLAGVLPAAAFRPWDGGYSISPRYVVPVLPLIAPPLAVVLSRTRGRAWGVLARAAVAGLVVLSLVALAYSLRDPQHYFFDVDAGSPLLADMSRDLEWRTGVPIRLHNYWPTGKHPPLTFLPSDRRRDDGVGSIRHPDGTRSSEELVHDPASNRPGYAAWGQYLTLPSGRYGVVANLKTAAAGRPDIVAIFDVLLFDGRERRVHRQHLIRGSDFDQPDVFQTWEIDLDHDGLASIEVRVYFTGAARTVLGRSSIIDRSARAASGE
ncbi:MAG TPA: hypothetical protein VGM69_07415 [Chloroflexota bacterium]